MKRFLTALTIASSLVFVAMPAMAAPKILSKKRLTIPAVSNVVVQKYFGNLVWKYRIPAADPTTTSVPGEIKNPPLLTDIMQEKTCGSVEYRLWSVGVDRAAVSKKLKKEVQMEYQAEQSPHLLQATQKGRSWYAPWHGIAFQTDCFGERLRLMTLTSNFYTIDLADVKSGKLKPPVILSAEARLSEPVILEGVYQYPGKISRSIYGDEAGGDSTIFVLEKDGGVTKHHPTRFRDYNTPSVQELKPSFLNVSGTLSILEGTFYRLPDGYGVTEFYGFQPSGYQPLDPLCTEGVACYGNEAPDYRIRNGEARYSMVAPFQPTEFTRRTTVGADYQTGIVLYQNAPFSVRNLFSGTSRQGTIATLVHGAAPQTLPKVEPPPGSISLGGSSLALALSLEKINGGSVVWETADRLLIRYYITPYNGATQYWEAVIQK